jgi:hypothetical protein
MSAPLVSQETRLCNFCHLTKSVSEFYPYQRFECKECVKKRVSNYLKTPQGKLNEKNRRESVNRKEWRKPYMLKWKKENPLKYNANKDLHNAVKMGKVIKPKICTIPGCFNTKQIEGHHPDYTKPLEVIWLCEYHHRLIHRGELI